MDFEVQSQAGRTASHSFALVRSKYDAEQQKVKLLCKRQCILLIANAE